MSDRENATNLEVVTHGLTMGRLDGGWNEKNVAITVLLSLGLEPDGKVANLWNGAIQATETVSPSSLPLATSLETGDALLLVRGGELMTILASDV